MSLDFKVRLRYPHFTLDFKEAVHGVRQHVAINGKQQTIKIPAGVDTGTRIRYAEYDIVMEISH